MATLTYDTSARQDRAAQAMTALVNAQQGTALTVGQFVRQEIDRLFARWIARTDADAGTKRGEIYNTVMTAEDKAIVDGVFAKYQG